MVWYITGSLWAQENLVEAFIWTLFLQAWWKFLGIYGWSTTVTGYLNLVAEIYNSYIRKLNLFLTNTLTLAVRKSEIVLILIYPQLFYCYYHFFVCFYLNTIYLRIHDSCKNFLQDLWSVFQSVCPFLINWLNQTLFWVALIWESFDAFFSRENLLVSRLYETSADGNEQSRSVKLQKITET